MMSFIAQAGYATAVINLTNEVSVIEADEIVDTWTVDARGRTQ